MRYISTRGLPGDPELGFWDILLEGLAPDGGLYLPREYPQVGQDTLAEWRSLLNEQGYAALAFDILKNNDLQPAWMQQRNEVLREIEKWRAKLLQTADDINYLHASATSAAAREAIVVRWRAQRRALQMQVDELNRRITVANLQLPTVRMEIFKLRLDEELNRAGIVNISESTS